MQSLTLRLEEMRVKRRDTEQWMRHRNLPHDIVQRVRRYDQYKWVATRGVDEETLVQSLPSDLRRDIKRHLCLRLVRNVSWIKLLWLSISISYECIRKTVLSFEAVDICLLLIRRLLFPSCCRCHSVIRWTRVCSTLCASA